MVKNLFVVMLLMAGFRVSAQDNTRAFYFNIHDGIQARVAVVPFEPRMLLSDLHRDMCVKNNMSSQAVKSALAAGFFHALRIATPSRTKSNIFGWEDEWPSALDHYFQEVGYRYAPLPDLSDQAREIHGVAVDQGELRTHEDTVTRYMTAVIPKAIITQLATETTSDYVLVISELDIVNLGTPVRVNPEAAAFYVRIHYDLYDLEGKRMSGGFVRRRIDNHNYDPVVFSREEFIEAARALYDALSLTVMSQTEGAPETRN